VSIMSISSVNAAKLNALLRAVTLTKTKCRQFPMGDIFLSLQ
jgi:hypothetical protein